MLYAARTPKPTAELDFSLLWLAMALLAIGLVMVYSASIATAEAAKYTGHNGAYYLMRQGIFIADGRRRRRWLRSACRCGSGNRPRPISFFVRPAVAGGGADSPPRARWSTAAAAGFGLGFANLQPSELMKFFAVMYAADYTTRKAAFMHDFKKGFLPMAAVMLLVGALLLLEPDFGAFVVIVAIAMGILFLGGLNWKVFAGLVVVLLVGFVLPDPDVALPPAARARFHGSVRRPVWQRLSVVPCADRLRPRRVAGAGAGRQRRKIVLSARSAHRFPAGGDRRRTRVRRRGRGDRPVRAGSSSRPS